MPFAAAAASGVERELAWELDRQVVLAQLQNVILALRSSSRFGSKSRFFSTSQQATEHPLLQGTIDLQNQLLFCSAPVPSAAGASGSATTVVDLNASTHSTGSRLAVQHPHHAEGSYERDVARSLRASMQRTLSEEDILTPFCAVCRNSDVSETIASVAMSGLVAILSRPCSFVSVKGVRLTLESIAMTRSSSSASSANSHEVLVARIIQAYTATIRHPAAVELAEESYVRVVSRTLVHALRPETSPLLKRTAESAMSTIVTTLYERVTASAPLTSAATAVPTVGGPSLLGFPVGGVGSLPAGLDGTAMMRYMSSLISGEVTALDSEGNTISAAIPGGTEGGKGSGSSPEGKAGGRSDGTTATTGKAARIVVDDSGPAIQLEGLWLAQAALFAVSRHLNHDRAHRLRVAVQNDLSRALLVAGVSTLHVVVLSQILRTIHIAVKCASQHLVPQMLSFLRVLHLNPLALLTEELSRAEGSPVNAPGGFFGGGGGGARFGSPQPQGGGSGGAGSPTGSPGSPTGGGGYFSSSQLMDMYERKEVLLESLTEFCSDSGFLSFCYAHFDLSWHYTPVLPQLCDVLVSNAYVFGELNGGGGGADGKNGEEGGGSPGGRGSPRAPSEGRAGSGHAARPVNRLQLVALDAAANMVSEVAFRTMSQHGPGISSSSINGNGNGNGADAGSQLQQSSSLPVGVELTMGMAREGVKHMIAQKKLLLQFASLFEESPVKKGIPFLLEHAVRVNSVDEEATSARRGKTWFVVRNPAGGREIGHTLFRLSVLLDKRALGDHVGDLGRERTPKPAAGDMTAILPDGTIVTDAADVAAILAAMEDSGGSGGGGAEGSALAKTSQDEQITSGDGAGAAGTPDRVVVAAGGARVVPAVELWEESRKADHLIVGTVRFYEEQLQGFIEMFDFRGKALLTAIREMVYRLCLPGESQKIDRIMEAFAKHWYAQNEGDRAVNPFHSDSGAFVLSFAIIMLNTVLHSKRLDRTLTLADFMNMNRGIDDGNNVPGEYLTAIYEDVQKHEVVMAEMMDRGFANNVTWDLEMNSVQERAYHGVDGTLDGMLTLMCEEEEAVSKGPQRGTAAATAAPARSREERIQLALDPYVFHAVWKRCLLVFTGMMESAGAQVARLSPRGTTVRDAIAHAKALMPTEVSALLSSLRGIQMLSRAAHALGSPGVADQCMLTLLPHVALELSGAQDVVDSLYRSLPKLLCTREVFALLRTTTASLADSWPSLADFILKLYLLGFFAMPSANAEAKDDVSSASSPALLAPPLPDVLRRNPGIVDSGVTAQRKATGSDSGGGGGGWFASFFGGGSSNGNSHDGGSGSGSGARDAAASRVTDDIHAITSQPRVRECVPDMAQLLRSLAASPASARRRFLQALATNSHDTVGKTSQALGAQEAFVLSHEVCLAAAVAFACPPPATTPPAQHDSDPEVRREAADTVGIFLQHLQRTLGRTLEVVARHTQRPRGSAAGSPADTTGTFWAAVGDRVVSGVLRVTEYGLSSQYGRRTSGGGHAEEGASPVVLESVWRETEVFLDLPQNLFNSFAALPIATFVGNWATALVTRTAETHPVPHEALEMQMLVPLVSRAVARLGKSADPAVLAALCRASHLIAAHKLYNVAQQTEVLVDAALSLGALRGEQEEAMSRGGRSPQTPYSSATSRASNARSGSADALAPLAPSDPGRGAATAAANAAPGEVVSLCCRNVLHACRACLASGSGESAAANAAAWLQLWIGCLRRLAGLVLCAGSPRSGSESLLSLQRALQDTELESLPANVVQAIYNDVLFPLVELVCAPGSEVQTAETASPPASTALPPPPPPPQQQQQPQTAASLSSIAPDHPSAAPHGVPSGFLASVFGTAAAAQQQNAAPDAAPPPVPLQVDQIPLGGAGKQTSLMPIVPAEVKCRVVNLLPKVLLQYTSSLAEYPELLQDLWQRVLGTLYAVYTAYPSLSSSSPHQQDSDSSPGRGDVDAELFSDEAAMMREAVEETVKNMVYVVAAMGTEAGSVFARVPYFSTSTRNLIRPFPFAGPLLAFVDSVESSADGSGETSPTR